MKYDIHRSETRGKEDIEWLQTRYSFSFGRWYDPARMGFGVLRVFNDDVIAPHTGFPPHGHRDMEIITLVMSGAVTHEDSMGNKEKVREGEVQVMSAGSGVTHAEYNDDDTPLSLFQIWIETDTPQSEPRYEQKEVPWNTSQGHTSIVGPMGSNAPLHIQQRAYIDAYSGEGPTTITLRTDGLYIFVVSGEVVIEKETLKERDAMEIRGIHDVSVTPTAPTVLLLIHTPLVY